MFDGGDNSDMAKIAQEAGFSSNSFLTPDAVATHRDGDGDGDGDAL